MGGSQQHGAVLGGIADNTPGNWRAKRPEASAAGAIHEIRQAIHHDALVVVFMAGQHGIGLRALAVLERPLQVST